MLSAAHVLAMDAKNLLDVIDSIRSRFPNLFIAAESRSNKSTPNNSATSSPSRKIKSSSLSHPLPPLQPPPLKRIVSPSVEAENLYQNSAEENQYQNLSNFNLPAGGGGVSTVQQQQSSETSQAVESLYANEGKGMYDNEQQAGDEKRTRPQVAAKPFNFNVVKVKTNFGNGSNTVNELKIVEDDLVVTTTSSSAIPETSCNINGAEIKLPEPVSCSIVQENIFKKNNSFLHKQ